LLNFCKCSWYHAWKYGIAPAGRPRFAAHGEPRAVHGHAQRCSAGAAPWSLLMISTGQIKARHHFAPPRAQSPDGANNPAKADGQIDPFAVHSNFRIFRERACRPVVIRVSVAPQVLGSDSPWERISHDLTAFVL
jgi:hypothetical protein